MRYATIASPLLLLLGLYAHAIPQGAARSSPAKAPSFEVATIKPSTPEERLAVQIQGQRFVTYAASVVDLLKYACSVSGSQIGGGPEWMSSQKFDIVAVPETTGRASSVQYKAMVQQLLADRFRLVSHRAMQELPVYALTVTKGGSRLTPTTREPNSIPAVAFNPAGAFHAGNAGMQDITAFLQRFALDRPVVDRTGLTGHYDIALAWSANDMEAGKETPGLPDSSALPGFYTALQEQLGLKLTATRAMVEVIVIDHLEQPSAN